MSVGSFREDERVLVESTMQEGLDALGEAGLSPGSAGMVYLLHHRDTVRRMRAIAGRKPLHEEIARALLSWARDEGDIRLYALRPLAVSVLSRHGADAMARAEEAFPGLALARVESFLSYMGSRMSDAP